MKTPKHIDQMLKLRTKLAMELNDVSTQIDNWLDNNGFNLSEEPLNNAVLTGCMIYTEPQNAEKIVREAIEKINKDNENN